MNFRKLRIIFLVIVFVFVLSSCEEEEEKLEFIDTYVSATSLDEKVTFSILLPISDIPESFDSYDYFLTEYNDEELTNMLKHNIFFYKVNEDVGIVFLYQNTYFILEFLNDDDTDYNKSLLIAETKIVIDVLPNIVSIPFPTEIESEIDSRSLILNKSYNVDKDFEYFIQYYSEMNFTEIDRENNVIVIKDIDHWSTVEEDDEPEDMILVTNDYKFIYNENSYRIEKVS